MKTVTAETKLNSGPWVSAQPTVKLARPKLTGGNQSTLHTWPTRLQLALPAAVPATMMPTANDKSPGQTGTLSDHSREGQRESTDYRHGAHPLLPAPCPRVLWFCLLGSVLASRGRSKDSPGQLWLCHLQCQERTLLSRGLP